MYYNLLRSIKLLSDQESVEFGIDNAYDHLWLLSHFRDQKISNKNIIYKETPSHRARKGKVYKSHKLLKPFDSIPKLLEYLKSKRYTIMMFELELESGLEIKIFSNAWIRIKINSISERDDLINRIISIAGLDKLHISELQLDKDYDLSHTSKPRLWDDTLLDLGFNEE